MLVITGVFWVIMVSIMVYFFIQELDGLKKATRMKVNIVRSGADRTRMIHIRRDRRHPHTPEGLQ